MTAQQLAAALRRRARIAKGQRVRARTIAHRILGPKGVGVVEVPLKSTRAMLSRVTGEWSIAIRPGVENADRLIAHELGHWAICVLDGRPEHTEEEADAVAGALLGVAAGEIRGAA